VIENISFKNRSQAPANLPIELKIVQDADRIDAIGAIGMPEPSISEDLKII
jgi:uncharacterized protein